MSAVEPGTASAGLVERVKSILLRPSATWDVIDVEPATISGLYKGYVIPLALIPAVAGLIGAIVFGFGAFGISFKPPILSAVLGSVVGFGATLLGVYVLALIIDGLAPTFGGEKNRIQAFKVAAYAGTASWVAGVFEIYPPLGILALLGLYSLFLLYKGLPRLMKTPEDKAMPYTIVVIIAAIVLGIVAGAIVSPIMRLGMGSGMMAGAPAAGTVAVGGKSIDLAKLEAASKKMEAAAKQIESGEGPAPTNPDVLKGYLPDSVAGYSRTEVTTGSGGAAGMSGSQAEGTYARGDSRLQLSVTDLGAAGALAGMASAFGVQSSSESDGKYEKIGKVDGRMTQESYDKTSKHGEYSVLIGDRFMVAAKGDGVSMDELKAAAAAVGPARLEALAKAG
ncbi:MAG: Yip1 family protein [Pseudomonadota bacterium]|uniref:Yip1 family protein n=1 Tax=Phenylobacterium sp. TaxID=1871053 RepID=UPI0025DCBEB6|nr:Yip1 family protein [Phenylobacterium sp.]MBT9469555.1 YIP1 family protein [Phenylobacterium sp.]